MAEFNLTQAEADTLIAMEKYRSDDTTYYFPGLGEALSMPLISAEKREQFLLDISRSRIDFKKITYQNRSRQIVVLVRLDIGGRPHRNPDDQEIPSPHLHIYREGYGVKWALPIPAEKFPALNDRWETLDDFMKYCNIISPPYIEKKLFT